MGKLLTSSSIGALFVILLGLCWGVTSAGAATINAASASYTDVSNAVSSAANGDTVRVPAGSATWTLTLHLGTKAISLIGAGSGSTIITNGVIRSNNTGNNPVRISGFRFNSPTNNTTVGILGFAGPSYKVRVDNCYFDHGDVAIATNNWSAGNKGAGPVWGVVDHCQFYNMKRAIYPSDVRTGEPLNGHGCCYGNTSWTEGIQPGTERMLFVENCQFVWDAGVLTDPGRQFPIYGSDGGKLCFRYNTTTGYSGQADAHGDGGGEASTAYYEIYNNTFNYSTAYSSQGEFFGQRGGQWIVHSNAFNNGPSNIHAMTVYFEADLAAHRVKNTYVWGNTRNGTPAAVIISFCKDGGQTSAGYSCANIRQNIEWFAHAPQSGQTYFPYTPYTYPHPLVTGGVPSPTATPPSVTPTPGSTATPGPSPTSTPTPPPTGLSFPATAGIITNPFVISSNSILQNVTTVDPIEGGRALYTFNVATAGDYQLSALVNCPDASSNSLFVNLDGEPTTGMVWSIPVTSGPENRVATWSPSTAPKVWTLASGSHQLIVRGREASTVVQHITLSVAPQAPEGLHVVP